MPAPSSRYSDAEVLVGVDGVVGEAEAREDRGDPLRREDGDHREGAAEAHRAGRQPVAASMPSAAAASTGGPGRGRRAGRARGPRSSASAPSGAAVIRPSRALATASASWPPASRSDRVADASAGTIVLTAHGSPQESPWTSSDGEASVRM